jgi:hypothetical protein
MSALFVAWVEVRRERAYSRTSELSFSIRVF